MSRAFSSEEYEEKEVVYEDTGPVSHEADVDLVFRFSSGRDVTDPAFMHDVGVNFVYGRNGFFKSDELAIKWLRRAVNAGHTGSCSLLARTLLKDTKTNGYTEAARLLKRAADEGERIPELDPSSITDPSTRTAFTTYRLNAELGDAESCMRLAEGFERELYGRNRYGIAVNWYRRALKRGVADAAGRIIAMHEKGLVTLTEKELEELR